MPDGQSHADDSISRLLFIGGGKMLLHAAIAAGNERTTLLISAPYKLFNALD